MLTTSFKQKNDDVLVWNQNRLLTWEDFKGDSSNANFSLSANTAYKLKYIIPDIRNDSVFIKVSALFYCNQSWKTKSAESKGNLLKHEQKHFDLTELYARKLRKQLINSKLISLRWLEEIQASYDKIKKELDNAQDTYDKETIHSQRIPKQLEWDKKIATELKSLEAYSNPYIIVIIKN